MTTADYGIPNIGGRNFDEQKLTINALWQILTMHIFYS
jgi:hypothetical protein